jgi:short-subunit dehydrogenase
VTLPRVLLVTGASSGIGRAVATRAAVRGDALVLVARDEEELELVADECRSRGAASVRVEPADVGDDRAVSLLVARTVEEHGRLDAVVNSAGVVAYGRLEDVPVEVFDGVMRTNLLGSANVARHVLPVLRSQRGGHLLLVGSVLGDIATPYMTAYSVSKWGIRALGRQLAIENRDLPDVRVSVVSPGGVDTPIYESAANYLGVPGRPPPPVSTPERVARAVLRVLDHPRDRKQVGLANGLMRSGFTLLPRVYDALVGPLFAIAALDRTAGLAPRPGAVLSPDRHGLRGRIPHAAVAVARNLTILASPSRSAPPVAGPVPAKPSARPAGARRG